MHSHLGVFRIPPSGVTPSRCPAALYIAGHFTIHGSSTNQLPEIGMPRRAA